MAEDFDIQAMQLMRKLGWPSAANAIGQTGAEFAPRGETLGGDYKSDIEPRTIDLDPSNPADRKVLQQRAGGYAMGFGPGILAGPKAAERTGGEVLKRFQEGEKAASGGMAAQKLWRDFGYAKGAEGKGRWEIPDDAANFMPEIHAWLTPDPYAAALRKGRAKDLLSHSSLFDTYPELMPLVVEIEKLGSAAKSAGGAYIPKAYLATNSYRSQAPIQLSTPNANKGLSTLLHELQHGVQEIEGFSRGGIAHPIERAIFWNSLPASSRQRVKSGLEEADKRIWGGLNDPHYTQMSGEVEARNVESRLHDSFLREFTPTMTEDIPRKWQISSPQAYWDWAVKGGHIR